ncbi:MAG: PAC2 family protein [Dehalococcoidia bacterium]|nr:PAC2 family protein [Dehalococcoidia bacterium]
MKKSHDDQVIIRKEPKLHNPCMVAAWPGVANVALEATTYLRDKLQAEEFAEIDAPSFFEVTGVYVEKNLVQPPRFPENKFYYWKRVGKEGDIILFLGEAQPSTRGREFADMILDVAQRLGVKTVYTCAAALISHFPEQPRVWVAATEQDMLADMEKQGLVLKGDFFVAGMNGLLLSMAKQREMRGVCLLGETPRYLSEMRNPTASQAVLRVLTRLLGVEIDMTEMDNLAAQSRQQIEELIKESRRQFISDFTVPLWERPQEEDQE